MNKQLIVLKRRMIMKRIDGGYESLFEFLVRKNVPFLRRVDSILYKYEHDRVYNDDTQFPHYKNRRFNDNPSVADQFIGSLQPFASMINDVSLTFKPYRSVSDFGVDLAQPLRGLGNVSRGVISFLFSPVYFVVIPFISIYLLIQKRQILKEHNQKGELKLN